MRCKPKFRDWGNIKISGLRYSNVGIVPFRIVPFELYTRCRAPLPLPEAQQNLQFRGAVQHLLRFSFNHRDAACSSSLRCTLMRGEIKMSERARSWKWEVGDHHHVCFDYKFPKPCELARCHNAGDRHGLNVVLGVLFLHPSSNTLERR